MLPYLPTDLVHIIIGFVLPLQYTPRPGFDRKWYVEHLTRGSFNTNPRVVRDLMALQLAPSSRSTEESVVEYLLTHPDFIDWYWFSSNTNERAVDVLLTRPDHDMLFYENPHPRIVASILDRAQSDTIYMESIDWRYFSANPNDAAVSYLLSHPELIDARKWSSNTHPDAVTYLLNHPDMIHWMEFSANTNDAAVEYALQNLACIHWCMFSENTNSLAVSYLIQHPEHIDWCAFSQNANEMAIEFLLQHPDEVQWFWLMENPGLFKAERNRRLESILFQDKYDAKIEHVFLALWTTTNDDSR